MGVLSQLNSAGVVDQMLTHAVSEWGKAWQLSIMRNFQSGGRPPWLATRRGGSILQDTGRLRNSIRVDIMKEGAGRYQIVGSASGIRYARIQQLGGLITPVSAKALAVPLTPEARKKKPADWGKELFLLVKGGKATLCTSDKKGEVTAQYVLMKSVRIPPRPYFMVQTEDAELLTQLIRDEFKQ